MAIRTLNYTGRQKLMHEDTFIYLQHKASDYSCFDAKLNLSPYKLPANAHVFVEAYRQTSWMRFDFGTVENITPTQDRRLTAFDSTEGILFRVKVTSNLDRNGLLLAEGDHIHARLPDEKDTNKIPLLPVVPDPDLEHEISRVSFNGNRTVLRINSSLGDWRSIAHDPVFTSLVYPMALREILTRILQIEEHNETDDDDWKSLWLRFSCSLPGITNPPDPKTEPDACEDWVDHVISAFCRHHNIRTRFINYWTETKDAA